MKRGPSRIYLMGGKLPPGITMEEVERKFSPFKGELEKVFKKWGSKKLVLLLDIEGGKVRSIQIKGFQGEAYKKRFSRRFYRRFSFPPP